MIARTLAILLTALALLFGPYGQVLGCAPAAPEAECCASMKKMSGGGCCETTPAALNPCNATVAVDRASSLPPSLDLAAPLLAAVFDFAPAVEQIPSLRGARVEPAHSPPPLRRSGILLI